MKFEVTYFDSLTNCEKTIRLTGSSAKNVKENFISQYNQKQYTFIDIKAL